MTDKNAIYQRSLHPISNDSLASHELRTWFLVEKQLSPLHPDFLRVLPPPSACACETIPSSDADPSVFARAWFEYPPRSFDAGRVA